MKGSMKFSAQRQAETNLCELFYFALIRTPCSVMPLSAEQGSITVRSSLRKVIRQKKEQRSNEIAVERNCR